jgi:drug/metabolite transporter (DMT)-like permease
VILFKKSGESVHPIALNLFKNFLASVLILPTLWIMGGELFPDVPANEYLLMLLSGALGIGIADTFFFMSLNLLGAGLSSIVDCLYSPFIIGLSMLWLGETLTLWQVVGVLMIVSAVLTATYKRDNSTLSRRHLALGVILGVLAMAVMAVGIVMVKPLLERSPLLWVSEIRLLGGSAILVVILIFHPSRRRIMATILSSQGRVYTVTGSFLGAYVAMILWLAGMKYASASVASALNQTSNIFVFILAALVLREPIDLVRTIGILLGVSGAYLVTFCG